jgi:D-inositol-3-phosphate glycosyltransferase
MPALGFINSFDELAHKEQRLGRKVANHGLVTALLQYSGADELHFFLPFNSALQPFEAGYAKWLEPGGVGSRVKLIHAANLPAAFERGDYLAVHAAELDRYFPELCHLRNSWANKPFPITCTTHTLSYWSTQVRNLYKLMPGVREFDSIICTSRAARGYMRACLEGQADQLKKCGFDRPGYSGRMDIVPLGVHCADFGLVKRPEARARLGLDQAQLVLLCVGRLSQSDKFDLTPLLGVMSLLAGKHDICLVLAGAKDSGYIDDLLKLADGLGLAHRLKVFPDFDSSLQAGPVCRS